MADWKEALRQLRKAPGFTATAVITLALGIGATTAIFTLVHQVMLKSLPVTKPEELVRVGDKIRCCNWGGYTQDEDGDFSLFSDEAYKNFRQHTPEFIDLAALEAGNMPIGIRRAGTEEQVATHNAQYVSGNFFRTLGVQPWIGHFSSDADDQQSAAPVAVMSYRLWREKYGSDPRIIGSVYEINQHPFTIVGIAPPGFYGAKLSSYGMPEIWLPLSTNVLLEGKLARITQPNNNFLDILGRIKPGVNQKALEAKMQAELHSWLASHVPEMEPGEKQEWSRQTLHLAPGGAGVADMRDQYEAGLKLLLIAAGCVLLVACGNLANLMLARGLKERSKTSLRVALGASRRRLIQKALVESVLLALLGGVLGIAVAYAGTRLILYLAFHFGGPNNYVPVDAAPSWAVLLFTLGVSVFTGVAFGIAPAWMTSHVDPVEALRGSNRSVKGGASVAQKALVIAQAAMSLVLLSAAALLGQSLRNLEHQDFGFQTQGRYVASINPQLSNYKPEQMLPLFRRIDDRLLEIPGVKAVAPVLYGPMTGDSWNNGVRISGRPEPSPKEDTGAGFARAMPGFFEALGAKVVQGRTFNNQDSATTRNVAVINEAFARKFFKNQNPVGQHFGVSRIAYAGMYEIIGVVRDIRYMTWGMKDPVRPMYWFSETQTAKYDDPRYAEGEANSHLLYNIIIQAQPNQTGIEQQVRKAIASVDPNLVLYSVDSYSKILEGDFQQENMIATLVMLFGGLGLVLAAVGLYGVMAYTVEQRTSEIGIRMALGANRGSVVKMVLSGAFVQVGIGLAVGIPLALAAGRLMTKQLYGVSPWDPVMLGFAVVMLCLAALLASWVPAAKAAGVEPMVALRTE